MATMGAAEIHPPRLITGDDLIALGFEPSPRFKKILREIEDHHLDGTLKTREEALHYVRMHYTPEQPAES